MFRYSSCTLQGFRMYQKKGGLCINYQKVWVFNATLRTEIYTHAY